MLSDDDDDDDDDDEFFKMSGVTKLIINEQDVTVKTCKIVEYTPSKLCENKGRA